MFIDYRIIGIFEEKKHETKKFKQCEEVEILSIFYTKIR